MLKSRNAGDQKTRKSIFFRRQTAAEKLSFMFLQAGFFLEEWWILSKSMLPNFRCKAYSFHDTMVGQEIELGFEQIGFGLTSTKGRKSTPLQIPD